MILSRRQRPLILAFLFILGMFLLLHRLRISTSLTTDHSVRQTIQPGDEKPSVGDSSQQFIGDSYQRSIGDKNQRSIGDKNQRSIGDSSVLYYDASQHHVVNGRVFLNDAADTRGLGPRQRADRGFAVMKQMRVAIAGTARNSRRILEMMRPRFEAMALRFKDFHFFFVENDSKDGTREFLLNWGRSGPWKGKVDVLGCGGVNLEACHVDFAAGGHVPGGKHENSDFDKRRNRVGIMARLRNIYLERIFAAKTPFDLVFVIDFDLMASFSDEGIARSVLHFQNGAPKPLVDAVCANARGSSLSYFWDACTVVYPPMSKFDPFLQPWELVVWKSVISNAIPREPGKWRPQKVLSCFQGFTIYRTASLQKYAARYKGPPPGYHTCEHNMLAYQLQNLYIEPSFDVHVTINNSEG